MSLRCVGIVPWNGGASGYARVRGSFGSKLGLELFQFINGLFQFGCSRCLLCQRLSERSKFVQCLLFGLAGEFLNAGSYAVALIHGDA